MKLTNTQQAIIDHLTNVGGLPTQAYALVHCASAASLKVQVFNLRKMGYKITTVRTQNRFNPAKPTMHKGLPGTYRLDK